jgi:2-octaprenyl-6-methoxyphenol hydroxylase
MSTDADIVIAGGGPVGAVLAHALAPLAGALRILRVGEVPPGDERPIALSWGSRLILEHLGLWNGLPTTPIRQVHVSQRGGFGRTLIQAEDHGVDALGYVVSHRELVATLPAQPAVPTRKGLVREWTVKPADAGNDGGITINMDSETLHTRLLILADGVRGRSHAPKMASLPGRERVKSYGQSAVVCEVTSEHPHRNTAWERFTPEGPIALLPFRDRHGLVWTSGTDAAEKLMALDENAFVSELQAAFGRRLGKFTGIGARAAFPLTLRVHTAAAQPHLVTIGSAAQTLHPVAGQGLNLALRDVWELAQQITDSADAHPDNPAEDLGSSAFTRRYAEARSLDRNIMVRITDGMIGAFGVQLPFASALRGAGLAFFDSVPPARRLLSRRMMFGARALP